MSWARQPIVIIGGILSFPTVYARMRRTLTRSTGVPVWIIDITGHDWLRSSGPAGWTRLLRKVDRTVRQAVDESETGKVTLVAHSAGGLVARLYLSPELFMGQAYRGLNRVDNLITLSSPHYYRRRSIHGGWLPGWLEERYPDAYFAPQVRYTSVAGKLVRGDLRGTLRERFAYAVYKEVIGNGAVWGDGLVPVASALLGGSHQLVLEGVSHYTGFGGPWFGAADVIPRWWDACWVEGPRECGAQRDDRSG
jgi:pimeloyl-ACP methyl ester carboxylesterase